MSESSSTHRAIEAVWKMEAARLIAGLFRVVRDVDLAEDLAQEALLAALEQWPAEGVPDNPGAWLMTAAKRRGIDRVRRDRRLSDIRDELSRDPDTTTASSDVQACHDRLDGVVEDDVLRLIFMSCHTSLPPEARAALTLRLVCGLTTDEIARSFLTGEPTIAQRIVRAKRILTEEKPAFDVPRGQELDERLASVLEVIYLLFNEGYTATAGDDWMRPALCEEAMRLGRILCGHVPRRGEVLGLTALMELQASRLRSRVDAAGRPVLLLNQDRSRWDQLLIRRGLAALDEAAALEEEAGSYRTQAEIAACHTRARTAAETDWARIVTLYDHLHALTHSPVVLLNRAVAVSMAEGAAAGLAALEAVRRDPRLTHYHLLPAVRGDLLAKLGRAAEAKDEFTRAARLTRNQQEQTLLLERAAACGS